MKNLYQSKSIKILAFIALLLGLVVYFKSSPTTSSQDIKQVNLPEDGSSNSSETKPSSEGTTENDQEAMVIDLAVSNYKFSQDQLTVKAGQTVTIKLQNTEGFHDLVIDELGAASEQIGTGQETSVTFTVPESAAGQTYEYYCSVGNHRELGMVGLLVIE